MLSALPALLIGLASLTAAQSEPACASSKDCQQLALEAAAREDFETFHSLAWRAVQTGQRNDADLMFLLARAQSLSGRPDDALVMLGRLADRGVMHPEVESLADFSRVREMAGWPNLLERMRGNATAVTPLPTAAPAERAVTPPPPAPPDPPTPPPAPARSTRAAPATAKTAAVAPAPASPAPAAPAAPPASPVPSAAEKTLRAATTITGVIPVPPAAGAPVAMAYDKVSARLILADDSSGTLKVLSEVSGNTVDLVSAGWGGGYHSNALMIDSKRGDLWVVGTRTGERPESVVHRLQLISGRLLSSVPLQEDAGASRFTAVALSSSSVYVLDAEGGRIFELASGAKALRLQTTVQQRDLTGLTLASDTVAYVAHAGGILRVDLASKRSESVKPSAGIALDGIEWIGYFDNTLLAMQRRADGSLAAVRFQLDRRGRTVTAADTIGVAAAKGAAIFEDTFYFVAAVPEGTSVARVNLRAAKVE